MLDIHELVRSRKTARSKPFSHLKPVSKAEDFTICHRDMDGETDFRYEPDDDIAICVVNSINIFKSMLENQTVRNAFTEIAKSYSQTYEDAWFLQEESPEHEGDMSDVADGFLQKILAQFPIVFVDDSWDCRRKRASNFRRPWDGEFTSRNICILLNGTALNHMVKAARQAKQATNNTAREHYEAFLFKHANTLLHEIGHVFITYLSKGGQLTPPTIIAQTSYKSNPDKGEAGRKLEALVFGGTIEYWEYPDAETRDDACGAPYLFGTTCRWRILPETIKRTVNCDFKFPYDHEKDAETRELKELDDCMDLEVTTDPMSHHIWDEWREALQLPPAIILS